MAYLFMLRPTNVISSQNVIRQIFVFKNSYIILFVTILLAGVALVQLNTEQASSTSGQQEPNIEAASSIQGKAPETLVSVENQSEGIPDHNLRLVGIIETGANNLALISIADLEEKSFSVNNQITDDTVLSRIWKDHVTLLTDGKSWDLYLRGVDYNDVAIDNAAALSGQTEMSRNNEKPSRSINRRIRWVTRNRNGDFVVGNTETDLALEKFGLKQNDIILKVNGRPARGIMIGKLNRFLTRPIKNRVLDVTIERDGKVVDLSIAEPSGAASNLQ